jgi:hypothetical protein
MSNYSSFYPNSRRGKDKRLLYISTSTDCERYVFASKLREGLTRFVHLQGENMNGSDSNVDLMGQMNNDMDPEPVNSLTKCKSESKIREYLKQISVLIPSSTGPVRILLCRT